ncbi:MAG TPA: 16S rRNA (cytidine(1402)-2'-O)-methyltransferase [Polyangiaceae bacterium]
MSAGTLYLVATPIGNLGDITHRAVDVLRACPRIAAEDTRHTHKLLSHFGIEGKKLDALHAHSSPKDVARLIEKLEAGEDVALVTDAGTPQVSDPGDVLVRAAIAAGIVVVPLPGPSAVLAALSASGLGTGGGFRFVAFLPRDGMARREAIGRVCDEADPVVLFEAPNRLAETLTELAAATPDRRACVAREITKMHEEFLRGTLAELAAQDREWKGEVVVVLGPHDPASRATVIDDAAIDARIDEELAKGAHAKGTAERLAAWSGRPKREIYERVLGRKSRE